MKNHPRIVTVTLNPAIDQTVTISDFKVGRVNRVRESRCDAGGKGVNVAAFLADYGLPVTATGFLGEENPRIFEAFFSQKKITDQFVRIAGSTRTGIKIVDDRNPSTTDINFPGQAPSQTDLHRLLAIIAELSARCPWFVISGSIPAGVPEDIYRRIIQMIMAKGGQVALDSSGDGFRQAMKAKPTLIKPNIEELEAFCGHRLKTQAEIIAAARALLDGGVQTVVVSMGHLGALFVERDAAVRATPPQVPVRSTVGAGDAMLGGMLAGKIEARSLVDCARLATAFSVIAVTRIGAGLPSEPSLKTIADQITLNVIPA